MTFFHVLPHFIWFANRNNKFAFATYDSFRTFWSNHVVNGLILILSPRWHAFKRSVDDSRVKILWCLWRNTNGKHFDRSYIFVLNILSLWLLTPSFIIIWTIRMLAFNTSFWWAHDHVMIHGPNSFNRRGLITFLIADSIPICCLHTVYYLVGYTSLPPSEKTAPHRLFL